MQLCDSWLTMIGRASRAPDSKAHLPKHHNVTQKLLRSVLCVIDGKPDQALFLFLWSINDQGVPWGLTLGRTGDAMVPLGRLRNILPTLNKTGLFPLFDINLLPILIFNYY